MIKAVHIPVFCADEASKASALLTLKTIRVGFPTAFVMAHLMGGGVKVEAPDADHVISHEYVAHDEFVRNVCENENAPFALVDSDVVFFDNCEDYETDALISGELIPSFVCPIAKAATVKRLHTAFFVVSDPAKMRKAIADVYQPSLEQLKPSFNPFKPTTIFLEKKPVFFDTCGVLYHAIGGKAFGSDMLEKFEHVWGGSYANQLFPTHQKFIDECYADPAKAKGFRKKIAILFPKT